MISYRARMKMIEIESCCWELTLVDLKIIRLLKGIAPVHYCFLV